MKSPREALQQADANRFGSVSVRAIAESCACEDLDVLAAARALGLPVSNQGFVQLSRAGRQNRVQHEKDIDARHYPPRNAKAGFALDTREGRGGPPRGRR